MALRKRHRLKFMPGAGSGDQRDAVEPTLRLSVGNLLRAERERRNLSVDDVAANLRIRRALIDAIEHGRFKELPGAPYAVGFVKTYAEFLELDREEVIRRFKSEAEGIENRKELHFPRPLSESRLPGGVLLLMSAVIAAFAYAFWHFQSADERTQMPRVAALPERLAPLADPLPERQPNSLPVATSAAVAPPQQAAEVAPTPAAPTSEAVTPAPEPAAAPAQGLAAVMPAPAPVPAPAASTPASPAETAAIPNAPADASSQPRVFGDAGPHRVVIRATADSWIQVRDTSGTVVFTRVMRPGDAYNVPNRTGLSLYTGSAGALEITVDGKVVPSVGQHGAVRRDVLLDPDRLQAGTAVMDQRRPSASDPNAPRPAAAPSSGG